MIIYLMIIKNQFYGYINKKKAETDLIRKIKKTFGINPIICYGDWSIGQQMRGFISTPNIGLKRKLSEHFKIYNLDEFRTSKLNYKTDEVTDNLYLLDKINIPRKLHSVLTFKAENNRKECINRDVNAVNNMIKLVNYYLQNNEGLENNRPIKFRRNFKLDTDDNKIIPEVYNLKPNNHLKKSSNFGMLVKSAIIS